MKIFGNCFFIWVGMLFLAGCSKEKGSEPALGDGYIHFGVPAVTVETRATEGFIEEKLPGGASFGVLGYCLAYNPGTTTYNANSGTSLWRIKSELCPPSVFYRQKVTMDVNGDYATYDNPKRWYTDGANAELGNVELSNTDEYQYTFFAYYPFEGGFTVVPEDARTAGAPVITYSMPYDGNAGEVRDFDTWTPDPMLAVTYNVQRDRRMVDFNFFHITTGLGFQVNNYSQVGETVEDEGDGGVDLVIYSIKLTGTFFRSVTADMAETAVEISYDQGDTYTATYVLYENEAGTVVPWQQDGSEGSISLEPEKYVRLLSGDEKNGIFGPNNDIQVLVDYQLGGNERKVVPINRPASFVPSPGTRYTAQLNWVNNAFVLIMQPDNGDMWEDGEAVDGNEGNDDVIFE